VHSNDDANIQSRDEIQMYLDARYVSATEAFARIQGWATHRVCHRQSHRFRVYEFTNQQEYPPVKQLQVHLENEHRVKFRSDGSYTLRDLHENKEETQLTAFFKANIKYAAARELLYSEFPSHFVWNTDDQEWHPRKKLTVYGRLVYIPPNAGEKFYARLVLSVAKNLQSFEDLRKFNGVLYPTI
jgi:hypothetical protein